jgi:very-short-patch-repair endonuclease
VGGGTRRVKLVGGGEVVVAPETDLWARLLLIARRQQGRVSYRQLIAAGLSPRVIGRLIRRGLLRVAHRGVYAVGHDVPTVLGDEVAALLAVGPPVALSHQSAAAFWEIWPRKPDEVELSVPGQRAKSRAGIRVHRCRTLTAADIATRQGLPVTTPERTILDLAEHHTDREVERAFDESLARRLISPTKIRALLARSPGRTGQRVLTQLADPERAAGVTREAAEERMLALIRGAGLRDPERNVSIGPYVVDMIWPERLVIVEVDSYQWHSGPAAFKRDRRKHAYLTDHGHEVHRVTWEMMEDPLPLIARLARAVPAA